MPSDTPTLRAALATAKTLDDFRTAALAAGFDEAIARDWAPHQVLDTHQHPFDAEALVVQGEMWLSDESGTRHLRPGDGFALARGTPHAERYGAEGATYWVARRAG
jgi:mannose-6-phosphate isomerase-like protein (cupin superfamily)